MFGDLRTKSPCCQEYENALAPILCTLPCSRRGRVSHRVRQNALVSFRNANEASPWCAVGLADWYAVSSADNCRRDIAEGSPKEQ